VSSLTDLLSALGFLGAAIAAILFARKGRGGPAVSREALKKESLAQQEKAIEEATQEHKEVSDSIKAEASTVVHSKEDDLADMVNDSFK
tara:strand:+ start:5385 stop:5651 length:267 start_codon:yes stop_codon:yes gene_type:complete